jgi:diadenosine tetraphosphate (Ap4A) HIT family hydrolase
LPGSDPIGSYCTFCRQSPSGASEIAPEQVVLRGRYFYVLVPLGQLIPGFLIIAPYSCDSGQGGARCLAELPDEAIAELGELKETVRAFFEHALGETSPIFYEQGRAGGGAQTDATGRFSHHAHLCCLPHPVAIDGWLEGRFASTRLDGLGELAGKLRQLGAQPYVYLESTVRNGTEVRRRLFTGTGPARRSELETLRLKDPISQLLGLPERANWRDWPAHDDVAAVIATFEEHLAGRRAVAPGGGR